MSKVFLRDAFSVSQPAEVVGEGLAEFFRVHCRDCQHVSGGAPAYPMLFAKAEFELTKGTSHAFWSVSERGHRVTRSQQIAIMMLTQ
jgi:hypothetical protein